MQALGEDDKANIQQTIDDEVLKRQRHRVPLDPRCSRPATAAGSRVEGDLTLAGATHPIAFDLAIGGDGTLSATAVVKQTDWGMKPYSALFGALKVPDDVEVVLEARRVGPQSR